MLQFQHIQGRLEAPHKDRSVYICVTILFHTTSLKQAVEYTKIQQDSSIWTLKMTCKYVIFVSDSYIAGEGHNLAVIPVLFIIIVFYLPFCLSFTKHRSSKQQIFIYPL